MIIGRNDFGYQAKNYNKTLKYLKYEYFTCIINDILYESFHFGHIVLPTIWPFFAMFLMSAITFFSCCSILDLSRSRSLIALFRARWFCLNISSGVFLRPKSHSKGMVDVLTLQQVESTHIIKKTKLVWTIMALAFKST